MYGWISNLAIATAIGAGLISGAFFAFSTFVMRALGKLPPNQGIVAMQRINIDVINPWFLIPFLGTALLSAAICVWAVLHRHIPAATWLLAGGLLYALGTFGATLVFNVPRNNVIATLEPDTAESEVVWRDYSRVWTAWNTVRTLAGVAAVGCFIQALRLA